MRWHRPQSRIGFENRVWHEQDLNPGTHTFDTQMPSSKRRLLYQLS